MVKELFVIFINNKIYQARHLRDTVLIWRASFLKGSGTIRDVSEFYICLAREYMELFFVNLITNHLIRIC